MGNVRLTSPLVRVVRDGFDDLDVQTTNADLVLWDMTRIKHKWPKFEEAPFLWLTFISWAAARRTGAIPQDYTFERWRADVLEVTDTNAEADPDDDADDGVGLPTPPGHEPG